MIKNFYYKFITTSLVFTLQTCFQLPAMDDPAMNALANQLNSQCCVTPDPLPPLVSLYPPNCSQQEKDAGLQVAAALGSVSAVEYLLNIGANVCADNGKAILCASKNGHLLLAHNLRKLAERRRKQSCPC